MDYKQLADDLVKSCLKKGADAAEVYLQSARNLSIEVRNGNLETVEEAASQGVGFRVFVKGRMAFSNCNDLRQASLDNAIARAIEFAGITTADENNVLPDDKAMTSIEGLYDEAIAKVAMDRKIEMAREIEKLAMKDPRVRKSAGAGYSESETEIFISNSNGISKNYKSSSCSLGVSVVAEKGEQKSSGGESCRRRFFADLDPAEQIAARAAARAIDMLDPRMVKTQRAAVVFDPDAASAVLGGMLSAIDGERVLQGASFLGSRLNQKIASHLVTLIDDATRPRGLASRPFDGEGVPTGRRVIVDTGVLKGFMYNVIAAKRAGVRSTGNASRGGFSSLPGIGPHSFYMAAGSASADDIVKSTKVGLLLRGVTGYGINPVSGDFSGGASGHWIENGRIAFPVKGLTIAATAADMLNGIDMVASNLDLNRTTTAPTFRIREMQIGGE
ncbi:MAG: TldD/PmbA family protein [Acidobacteria bacterium]|nr:MAG: TldD/PmbA family protein [Acidobacteriota bacterium]